MLNIHIILILTSIVSWFFLKTSYNGRVKWLQTIFLILIITRCLLKWDTWLDLPFYADGFDTLIKGSWNEFDSYGWSLDGLKAEPLWMIYNWIIGHIIPYFPFLLFVTALLNLLGYYFFVRDWIKDKFWIYCVLLILVGSYSQSFYVLRQHLSIGLVVWSYSYMLKKDYTKMIILFLLAFGFHQTAIFVLPAYIFNLFIKNTKITLICIVLYAILITFIIQIMPLIVGNYFADLSPYATLNDESMAVNNKMAILQLALLLLRWLTMKNKCWDEGVNRFITLLMILGVINAFAGTGTTYYMSRLNMYYTSLTFLYIPNTLSHIKSYDLRTIIGVGYFLLMLYFTFRSLHEIPVGQSLFIFR